MLVKNLSKSYDGVNQVIKDFSFDFEKGKIYVIKGISGCGKTTLLNILGHLDTDFEGEVDYVENTGYISQRSLLYSNLTIFENLRFINDSPEDIIALSKELSVDQLLNKYPNEISGGERQRISVIRTLLKNPELILADEPSSALDSTNSKNVAEAFSKISTQNNIIIISTHKSCFDDIADTIIDLQYGKINSVTNKTTNKESVSTASASSESHRFNWKVLLKKNKKLLSLKKSTLLSIFILFCFIGLSILNNFETEYINFYSRTVPSETLSVLPSQYEIIKEKYNVTKYDNYVIHNKDYSVLPLFEKEQSGLAYGNMIEFGAFPAKANEVLVNQYFSKSVLNISDYQDAIGKYIVINNTKYYISGVLSPIDADNIELYYSNTYYQQEDIEENSDDDKPYVYMPYDSISKIGTIENKPTIMITIDNLYENDYYHELRNIMEGEVSNWDVNIKNISQTLELVIYILAALIIFIMFISFAFQWNEIKLNLFYRRKELGWLQLFGLSKKKIVNYLISERLITCLSAILISTILFHIMALVLISLHINIFIPLWQIAILIFILLGYNILLTLATVKSTLKKDIIKLIT